MGPGRWGSRGDIKLGVNVTYSDINNSAVLVEIARKKGNYVPDLSFGTHFFQDLVEAGIRYLPLYPDDGEVIFNEDFLSKSPNALFEIFPAYTHLSEIVRVIDVASISQGKVLRILMNADQEKAVGMLAPKSISSAVQVEFEDHLVRKGDDHWRWRLSMVEKLAAQMHGEKFGVRGIFLIGSTVNATAQAGSDIDLLVNFYGSHAQKLELQNWLQGWSLCLDELNFMRTGYKAGGLLDVHYVTDEELEDLPALESLINVKIDNMRELMMANRFKEPAEKENS
jgi:hypothetical protein